MVDDLSSGRVVALNPRSRHFTGEAIVMALRAADRIAGQLA